MIRFNEALRVAFKAVNDSQVPKDPAARIVRDVYGRLRFAVDSNSDSYPDGTNIAGFGCLRNEQ
jgi:hypothetical protein